MAPDGKAKYRKQSEAVVALLLFVIVEQRLYGVSVEELQGVTRVEPLL